MKTFFIVSLVACGSKDASPPPPKQGVLETSSTVEDGVTHVHAAGKAVPLGDIPLVKAIGLPAKGTADINVELQVPMADGKPDYRRATGAAEIKCTAFTLGDDVTKLKPGGKSNAFVGDGIQFGHITFDNVDVQVVFESGHADVKRWVVDSPDIELHVGAHLELAQEIMHSTVDGCIRYKPTAALAKRDPATANVISLIGGAIGPDDMFAIKLDGQLDNPRRLGQVCDVK